jgi:oligopeptidase B
VKNNSFLDTLAGLNPPRPPKRIPTELKGLGGVRVDDFYWLRDKDDPDTKNYIEAENTYYQAVSAQLQGLADEIFTEIRSKVLETDMSVPAAKGPYEYYGRTEEGKQYAIHCRRLRSQEDTERVLLDENVIAEGHDYMSIGTSSISPDHKLIAYSVDFDGSEVFQLNVAAAEDAYRPFDVLSETYYGIVWSADSKFIFYITPDDAMRPYRIYRHRIGSPQSQDQLVYEEQDERFFLDLGKTSDERFIVIDSQSKTTTEQLLIPSESPLSPPKVFMPRRDGVEYSIDTHEEATFMVTNRDRVDFSVLISDERNPYAPDKDLTWENYIELSDHDKVEGIEIFKTHVAVLLRSDAHLSIKLVSVADRAVHEIPTPDPLGTLWPGVNAEYDTEFFRYGFTSFTTPTSIFEISLKDYSVSLIKAQPVLGGFSSENYSSERLWATSHDGVRVPISLVHRVDLDLSEPKPTLLYGYGSYEHSIDPTFSVSRLSLLDRGFIFAVAHVRGGGELGRKWYEDGKLEKKSNTFHDFVACATHLIAEGYTAPDCLVARGGSAGGLLMGAVLNLRPDLFKGVIAEVPFVDCLTTISDPDLPLTVTEWEEWGNPLESREIYETMLSYSPYDNYRDQGVYPFLYVSTGLNDPRVSYWEPLKWVAKIRSVTPKAPTVLKVEMGAGHMGPTGRYDAWRDESSVLAFVVSITK